MSKPKIEIKEEKQKLVYQVKYTNGYVVEIEQNRKENTVELWIYREDTGVKMFMFGLEKESYKEIMLILESNIKTYMNAYRLNYISKN